MAINKGELFSKKDMYVDYAFEEVMYRWDHKTETVYVKFYGQEESLDAVDHGNRLFNDALLSGLEITRDEYFRGK